MEIVLLYNLMVLSLASWLGFFRFPQKKRRVSCGKLKFLFVAIVFLLFLMAQLLITPVIFFGYFWLKNGVFPSQISPDIEIQGWFNILAMVLSFTLVAAFFLGLNQEAKALIWQRGYKKIHSIKSFFFGMSAWFISYPLIFLIGQVFSLWLFPWLEISESLQTPVKAVQAAKEYPVLYLAMGVSMGFLVPITEELLFRGFLQTWLRDRLGVFSAILITSLIFASFHYSYAQGFSNIPYMIALGVLSFFLGFIYEREHSLLAPIGLHITFNTITLVLLSLK